jgi:hypothetical protein
LGGRHARLPDKEHAMSAPKPIPSHGGSWLKQFGNNDPVRTSILPDATLEAVHVRDLQRRLTVSLGLSTDPTKQRAAEMLENFKHAEERGDREHALHLTRCYAQQPDRKEGASPPLPRALRERVIVCIMLSSSNPILWRRALRWLQRHGTPREQVWACRLVMTDKLGLDYVLPRLLDVHGQGGDLSMRDAAELLGMSKSDVARISKRLREEESMNALATAEIIDRLDRIESGVDDLKLHQRMQGERDDYERARRETSDLELVDDEEGSSVR